MRSAYSRLGRDSLTDEDRRELLGRDGHAAMFLEAPQTKVRLPRSRSRKDGTQTRLAEIAGKSADQL
jgi:hypothetical protein